jgi:glycosyltransferase involved in cell wall biosynthesis
MTADCVGGVWTYALDLARGLAQQNVRVSLATMGTPPSEAQQQEAGNVSNLDLYASHYKLEWEPDPWADVNEAGAWLLQLERDLRPDIVHLNGYAHGNLPFTAPVLCVGHSCVLSWWEAVKGEPAPPECGEYRERVRAGLHGAGAIVAPTRAMANALTKHYGPFLTGEPFVVPNGRDPAMFTPGKKEPFIFSAGRFWDEAKNLEMLRHATPDVRTASGERYRIGVAGALPDELKHADFFPEDLDFQVLPWLAPCEIAQNLSHASVYVLPARYEPFGLSVLEAALSGCALVLGDIDSLRENWNGVALFVHPDDTKGLAETLSHLMSNNRICSRLGQAARERAQHFTVEAMATHYRTLYNALLP